MATHLRVLCESYLLSINMIGFIWFRKSLYPCALDENSLSINLEGLKVEKPTKACISSSLILKVESIHMAWFCVTSQHIFISLLLSSSMGILWTHLQYKMVKIKHGLLKELLNVNIFV